MCNFRIKENSLMQKYNFFLVWQKMLVCVYGGLGISGRERFVKFNKM